MPEDKRKINCWIPVSLYDKIGSAGYEHTTQAIITALQRLLEDPGEDIKGYIQNIERYLQDIEALKSENTHLKDDLSGYQKDIVGYKQDTEKYKKDIERIQKDLKQDIEGYKQDMEALQTENAKLKDSLQDTREPGELLQLRAKSEELEKHNTTLKAELDKAERDKEDLKTTYNKLQDTYNNYMAQMQTLIKQKSIEAPGAKKPWWQFW
jgi:chromosome segregation ATPase